MPNTNNGVDVVFGVQSNTIGGTTAAARNLISGNLHEGVLIGFAGTANNVVEGNFIGTDITGKAVLASQQQLDGVYVGLGAGSIRSGDKTPSPASTPPRGTSSRATPSTASSLPTAGPPAR